MTTLRHAALSKTSRPALFVPGEQEHSARCACGYETLWTVSLRRAEDRMSEHVYSLRGQTFTRDLSPSAIEVQRRLDACALEYANGAMREMVNSDLRRERLSRRSDHVLTFAGIMLIIAALGAAYYFHEKGKAVAAEVRR
jgi:hypothetical protein